MLASIGHNKAVAETYGILLYGLPVFMIWRGIYLMKVPTWVRKMRLFLEWTWSMFFPPNIAHMGYKRTGEDWFLGDGFTLSIGKAEKVNCSKLLAPSTYGVEGSIKDFLGYRTFHFSKRILISSASNGLTIQSFIPDLMHFITCALLVSVALSATMIALAEVWFIFLMISVVS